MQNQIPKNWQKVKLSDVCYSVSEPFDFKKNKRFVFINTADIEGGNFINRNYFDESYLPGQAKKAIKKDDILYSEIRPKNKHFAYVDFDADKYVVSTKLMVIRNKKNISPNYLYLLLTNRLTLNNFQTIAESRSGTFPQLTFDAIANYDIMLPQIDEQQLILKVASSIDDKIEVNNKIAKTLEEMAQVFFKEWFVSFRFLGYGKVKFVDSELGKIPKGWNATKISEIYKTTSGGTPSRKNNNYYGGNIRWIKTGELRDGFIFDTEEYITEEGLNNSSAKLLPKHAVLIAMYGATIGQMGITALDNMTTNQACCAILQSGKHFDYKFIFLALKNILENIIGLQAGAAQQNINQQIINNFYIISPSIKVLKQFNILINPVFNKLENIQLENQKLAAIRDLLLPKLMKGEVRV